MIKGDNHFMSSKSEISNRQKKAYKSGELRFQKHMTSCVLNLIWFKKINKCFQTKKVFSRCWHLKSMCFKNHRKVVLDLPGKIITYLPWLKSAITFFDWVAIEFRNSSKQKFSSVCLFSWEKFDFICFPQLFYFVFG